MPIAAANSLSVSQPSVDGATDSSLDEAIAASLLDNAGFTIHNPKTGEGADARLDAKNLDV